ncbi:MAG: ABC transporter substrate-binding protein [Chloroflexi bacterium]|nr:ABC transporter substrate-binding protein [Chloroflexota bacterium]
MLTSRVAAGALAAMGLAVAVACAPAAQPAADAGKPAAPAQAKYGGVLTWATTDDPPSFDLSRESTTGMQAPTAPNYDYLVMFDPKDNTKVVGDLAEKWELSPDGKTYTFHLIKGVKYHNGNPFTSADVKFSLERVKSPPKGAPSPRQGTLDAVERIETPDDATVRVVLKRPTPSLLMNLSQGWFAMFDKELADQKTDEVYRKEVMGTGPFKFKEYIRGTSIELVKNPDYWVKGRPYLDGYKFFIIPDRGTRLAAFRTGQILIYPLDAEEAKQIEAELPGKVTVQRMGGYSFQSVNVNAHRKPFDDPRVRQALSLAIDREAAIKVLYKSDGDTGGYLPATGQWALSREEIVKIPGYGRDKAADIARAKQLLAEAGVPEGFKMRIHTRKGSDDLSIFLKDQWGKVGLIGELLIQDSTTAYDTLNKRDFELYPWGQGVPIDDPDAIYSEHISCEAPRNYGGLCDREMEALFQKQSETVDVAERKKLVQEMERKALLLNGKLSLGWSRVNFGSWNTVKDFVKHPGTYSNQKMRDVWLDQ